MDLVEIFNDVFKTPKDDDMIDRLNHTYTRLILILFAVIVCTEQYAGSPINCWTPPQFKGIFLINDIDNYAKYTQKICWIQNTYRIPMNKTIPETNNYQGKLQLRYYQWAPFIFLTLSLFYFLPCLFWRANNKKYGLNLKTIVDIGNKYHEADDNKKKDEQIKIITKHFNRYLENKKYTKGNLFCFPSKLQSLTAVYITSKVLYLLNAVAQLFLTDLLLCNGEIKFYGLFLLRNAVFGIQTQSELFPRVAYCDFYVREMGQEINGHRYTVQCVLSINLYLEAIFAFYWFWLCLLIFLNLKNTIMWCWHILSTWNTKAYIHKYIRPELRSNLDLLIENPKYMVTHFIDNYLDADGIFVMRLISQNISHVVATDLISALYENYKIIEVGKRINNVESISDRELSNLDFLSN
ncbi:innexin unc-9-like [Octopus sinensis]|uniref:Innexin n=1 Tax=Octopus sinensis TaxID=2607531 RepID=A0A6P7U3Y2_9MOLL|nr:innexin unc-9-like [Octopus sinensis]